VARRGLWSFRLTVSLTILLAVPGAPAFAAGTRAAGAAPAARAPQPLPLEQHFDNSAVGAASHPGAADFEGAGHSLSADELRAAGWLPGQALGLDGATQRWPRTRPGDPDNVVADGQRIRVRGAGGALCFLVAGTSPDGPGLPATGRGTVDYRDGSATSYALSAPDWRGGPLATKAVSLPHINAADGTRLAEAAKLYAVAVPVAPGREITSVTLPRDPGAGADLHVFAVSVRARATGWSGSWAAGTSGYTAVGRWRDQTLRLIVHSSAGGSAERPAVRVRLANTFAPGPVTIGHASLALQGEGAAARGLPVPLRFGGHAGAVLPAGAQVVSDPAPLRVPPGVNLLVSIHLPGQVTAAPVHSEAQQLSYVSDQGSGDRSRDAGGAAFTGSLTAWPFLTGVDVRGGPGSLVTLGDSITDGVSSTVGANMRWPDVLSRRLAAQHEIPRYGVLNHGISANRVVTDRYPGDGFSTDTGGVSAVHRLERDVLAQPSARTVLVFEGVNDVRAGTGPPEVIAALREIAARARARGLRVLAATITPCGGYADCTPQVEARRQAVNSFIRDSGGAFDATTDFDAAVRDPAHPERMRPGYDSGDHLHPGDAGLRALADSVSLRSLAS
jgi:lysophospholipase L1-like esterase